MQTESEIHIYHFEHIELPAKLLDYFLRSNTSNINPYIQVHAQRAMEGGAALKDVSRATKPPPLPDEDDSVCVGAGASQRVRVCVYTLCILSLTDQLRLSCTRAHTRNNRLF